MLPKNQRISRGTFPLLLKGAKFFSSGLFLLRFVLILEKESRISFSVSKKIAKNAVVRNKMRRFGYRAIKDHLAKIKPSILAVFYFKRVPKDYEEVASGLKSVLKESNLIK